MLTSKWLEILLSACLAGLTALFATHYAWPMLPALLLTAVAGLVPRIYTLLKRPSLQSNDQFLQQIIDIIPEPVYIKDREGRYRFINQTFMQELARPANEIIGHTALEIFGNDYGAMVSAEDKRILAGRNVFKEEHSPNPNTGKERYQIVVKELSSDPQGKQVIIGTNFNITRWRLAERSLHAALDRERAQRQNTLAFMQRFIDAIPEPIYIKNADSRFILVNAAFAQERQRPAQSLIGVHSNELAADQSIAEMAVREDQEILRTQQKVFKEYRTQAPGTQETRYRLVHKKYCLDADKNPIIVGAHFDITELRQVEQTLKQSLEREVAQRVRVQNFMQRLIDVIPQPVYVKDAESHYLIVNQAFAEERRRTIENIIGYTPLEIGDTRSHSEHVMEEDLRVIAGETINKEENRPHPLTGEKRFRFISKGSCLDAEGNTVIVGANFDITEWRLAEERAEQASAAKSLFLANMSHEIRTPLSGMIGTLNLALEDKQLNAETHEYLSASLANAESLLSIISDILDLSKIEAGQLKIETIDFDFPAHIRESIKLFDAHAATRSLQFELSIDSRIPQFLRGDPTRIRQVLNNLVGNAVKFTERGGVWIRIEPVKAAEGEKTPWLIRFSVRDTGIGISHDAQQRLFQKFQQADVSTSRRYGGTGLGLAICRELVEAMHGKIEVQSEESHGTTFSFTLPLNAGSAPIQAQQLPLVPHARVLRVLCAEDVPVNQLIIRTQLKHMGHHVDMVGTGIAAIEALSQQDYDVVLMDGRMPEMDGIDATIAIRQGGHEQLRVRQPQIPIIALTANASEEDRRQYLGAGMNNYLTKPVSERQLHAVLEQLINNPNG